MTLGHVIIGRDPLCLEFCRDHEQAHVRQVERWGLRSSRPTCWPVSWHGGRAGITISTTGSSATRGEPVANPIDSADSADARRDDPRNTIRCTRAAHVERHFTASELVRDIVIGMSDGLTVPFALAAGLSGTDVATTAMVVTAGLAEIAAGSIAMGLGGYLAAKSDAEHYVSEKHREEAEIVNLPDVEREEVAQVFREYGLAQLTSNRSCKLLKTTIRPGSIS